MCAEIALLESRLKRPKFKKIAQITTGREVREKEGEGMREKGVRGGNVHLLQLIIIYYCD